MPPATPPIIPPTLLPPPLKCGAGELATTTPGVGVAAGALAAGAWLPADVLGARTVPGLSRTLVTDTSVTFNPAEYYKPSDSSLVKALPQEEGVSVHMPCVLHH